MDKEIRDASLLGGLIILLIILWFAAKPMPQKAPDEPIVDTPVQPSGGSSISYNMPPLLTLPPYNAGNMPTPVNSDGTPAKDPCSCNACNGSTASGAKSYGDLSQFWGDIQSGIVAPTMVTPSALPDVKPIVIPDSTFIPAGALSFADWKAVESIGPLTGTSFVTAGATGFPNHTVNGRNQSVFHTKGEERYDKLLEVIPGADVLSIASDKTKFDVYKMLGGAQWRDVDANLQQKVIDFIYSQTT